MLRKLLITILACAAVFYLAILGYVYAGQDELVFYPIAEHAHTPADYGIEDLSEHHPRTPDGETLHAWYVAPGQANAPVLLYCHGNAGNLSYNLEALRQWQSLGFGVFAFDYRGFGKSTGTPQEDGLYLDARAAYDYLRETIGIPPDRIVLLGRSLGGAVAIELATQSDPIALRALVIESSFRSAVELGQAAYPFLPVGLLARHRFESHQRLLKQPLRDWQGQDLPVLVVHSRRDQVIPFAHGRSLFEAARTSKKQFLEIEGGHNDGFLVSRRDYEAALQQFLFATPP